MGFFTDAYDLFSISLVTKLLGRLYYTKPAHLSPVLYPQPFPPPSRCRPSRNPRRPALLWVARRLRPFLRAKPKGCHGNSLFLQILARLRHWWRLSPLRHDHVEYANKKTRGAFIAAVFAMQGFGILFSGVLSLIVAAAFDSKFKAPTFEENAAASTVPEADYVWRIILMFGAFPAAVTYYWRMKMPETARYTALVYKNAKQAAQDMAKVLNVELEAEEDKLEKIGRHKSNNFGLFSREFPKSLPKDVFSAIGWIPPAKTMNAIHEVYKIARAQTLIALCGTVPGYWFTVAFIDRMGRFAIQLMGFFFMTVFMFAIAIPYNHWRDNSHIGFVVMYGLTFFFANFGPNATTFVVPAEIFPARLRSTCHGISAATGKAGAIVGAYGFLYAAQSTDRTKTDAGYPPGIGIKNSLIVLGVINAIGMLCTFAVPEPKGKSLEEASQENVDATDEAEGV
ncbi:hypothetical protein DH2020_047287 [Rehmannia glutinosa]|uniref:Major facilitator superfamily (MFS) profile domain-containing protein n=1 Tax=Rehmannia glutinosa TaxID=99300 RepID=A0ABR0U8Z9_REHGL